MSVTEDKIELGAAVILTDNEQRRLVEALTNVITNFERISNGDPAIFHGLEAARLFAERGSYHYEAMSALLAKPIFHMASINRGSNINEMLGEALRAHLDIAEPA